MKIRNILDEVELSEEADDSYSELLREIKDKNNIEGMNLWLTSSYSSVINKIMDNSPNFVYYSSYGNLDSEIYLPHVIENLQRNDLTGVDEVKARTLKVSFEFAKLDSSEILEMGMDAQGTIDSYGRGTSPPTDEEIEKKAEKKKECNILLQSASTSLTKKIREW